MEGVTEEDKIRSEHTMFSVDYQTDAGIQLHLPPLNEYCTELTHPKDYSHAQQLGTDMRVAGIEAFEYESARDSNNGICVALYNTSAFCQNKPKNRTEWLCETILNEVSFKQIGENEPVHFPVTTF